MGNNTDFTKIEKFLNIELPQYYKDYISDYPQKATNEGIGLAPDDEGIEDLYLYTDAKIIIDDNLYMRKENWDNFNLVWKDSYFQIGIDGTGGYYFIDVDSKKETIYFFHIDDNKVIIEATSLDAYIEDTIEMLREFL